MKVDYTMKNGQRVLELELSDDWAVVDPKSAWPKDSPNQSKDFLFAMKGFDARTGNLKHAIENFTHLGLWIEKYDVPSGQNAHDFIQNAMRRRNRYVTIFEPEERLKVDGKDAELHTWTDGPGTIAEIFVPIDESHVVGIQFFPPITEQVLETSIAIAKDIVAKVKFC